MLVTWQWGSHSGKVWQEPNNATRENEKVTVHTILYTTVHSDMTHDNQRVETTGKSTTG